MNATWRTSRRGLTITEMVVSLGILAGMCTLIAQWFVLTAVHQKRSEEQRHASQTASNLMEQVFALPWEQLTSEKTAALAANATETASGCECTATITDVEADSSGLQARRIHVRVVQDSGRIPPLELLAWRHAEEAEP